MSIYTKKEKIRVLVADNQPLFRAGIASVLSPGAYELCGETGDYVEAISIVKKLKPEIIIMDIFTNNRGWSDFISDVKTLSPGTQILVISMLDEEVYSEKAIKAGASGFLSKTSMPGEIADALRAIMRNEIYLRGDVSSSILRRYMSGAASSGSGPEFMLSDRELEVFGYIGAGLSSREIGGKIGVSSKTVDNHKANIKEKMGYRNFIELAQAAVLWIKKRNQGDR